MSVACRSFNPRALFTTLHVSAEAKQPFAISQASRAACTAPLHYHTPGLACRWPHNQTRSTDCLSESLCSSHDPGSNCAPVWYGQQSYSLTAVPA